MEVKMKLLYRFLFAILFVFYGGFIGLVIMTVLKNIVDFSSDLLGIIFLTVLISSYMVGLVYYWKPILILRNDKIVSRNIAIVQKIVYDLSYYKISNQQGEIKYSYRKLLPIGGYEIQFDLKPKPLVIFMYLMSTRKLKMFLSVLEKEYNIEKRSFPPMFIS